MLKRIKSQSLLFKRDTIEIVKDVLKPQNDILSEEHGRLYF